MRVGERTALRCVNMYVHVRMACLMWLMPAVAVTYFHDYMQVPLMWPMPAATVTSSLPRLNLGIYQILDWKKLQKLLQNDRKSALKLCCLK